MHLSAHFTLAEFCVSQEASRRGIDNTPPPEVIKRLERTAEGLEAVRIRLGGAPIVITSGYRCADLNRIVGGSPSSQHLTGDAADFICPRFGNASDVTFALADSGIEYDQLIAEFGAWTHISFAKRPRHQALVIDHTGTRPLQER